MIPCHMCVGHARRSSMSRIVDARMRTMLEDLKDWEPQELWRGVVPARLHSILDCYAIKGNKRELRGNKGNQRELRGKKGNKGELRGTKGNEGEPKGTKGN